MQDRIDVMNLCGDPTDLPVPGPHFASVFNTSQLRYPMKIPDYFRHGHEAPGRAAITVSFSCGGIPDWFLPLARVLFGSVLPDGQDFTFWGRGVSQGHSDAIRRIPGVVDARQYTQPIEQAVAAARSGNPPSMTTREKHLRECLVVAEEGADHERDPAGHRHDAEQFCGLRHNRKPLCHAKNWRNNMRRFRTAVCQPNGKTLSDGQGCREFTLRLDINLDFTASVLTA